MRRSVSGFPSTIRAWRGLPPEKTANLTEAKAVALAVANPSLIRRPLIEHKDGSVTVGFSKKIQDLLA